MYSSESLNFLFDSADKISNISCDIDGLVSEILCFTVKQKQTLTKIYTGVQVLHTRLHGSKSNYFRVKFRFTSV